MNNEEALLKLHKYINQRLEEIEKCFLAPKVTLLIRNPDIKNGDLLLTKDDVQKVIKSLQKLSNRSSDEII